MTTPLELGQMTGGNPAGAVDRLFAALTVMSVLITLTLAGLVLVWGIKYRASSPAERPAQNPSMSRTELVWVGGTLTAFLSLAVWANVVFIRERTPPAGAYTVYAEGKQWMWKVEHPSGRREIDELHVPVGEPVRVVLTSADVIHSFYLPHWRVKQDAVPGRYTALWLRADEPGEWRLFCAEYCGNEHSGMVGHVVAMPRAEFSRWLAERPLQDKTPGMPGTSESLEVRGAALFDRVGCAVCHVRTSALHAPRLDGIWGRPTRLTGGREVTVDESYIRESILDPNTKITAGYASPSLMPSYAGSVDEQGLRELVEFIRSLRDGWPERTQPPPRGSKGAP